MVDHWWLMVVLWTKTPAFTNEVCFDTVGVMASRMLSRAYSLSSRRFMNFRLSSRLVTWRFQHNERASQVKIPDFSQEFKGMDTSFPCLAELSPRQVMFRLFCSSRTYVIAYLRVLKRCQHVVRPYQLVYRFLFSVSMACWIFRCPLLLLNGFIFMQARIYWSNYDA